MRDVLGSGTILGYCTNVRGEPIADQLNFWKRIKDRISPAQPMGLGWWISGETAYAIERWMIAEKPDLNALYDSVDFIPFTFNGFPYGRFHTGAVKHKVYEPDWATSERKAFTRALIDQHCRLDGPRERSISTLPIGWPGAYRDEILSLSVRYLLDTVEVLHAAQACDRDIHLDLEPEPGCVLQRSDDVVRLFDAHLLPAGRRRNIGEDVIRHHLRVCHDICHAAVMHESQVEVLNRYRRAGIRVGKVQISSGVRCDLRDLSPRERLHALEVFRSFAEDRYLHQTMIATGKALQFFEDLPDAIAQCSKTGRAGDEWRVHFHVPVYLGQFGPIQTTRDQIGEFLRAIRPEDEIHHFEVETYAWDVLPPELRVDDLAEGIAREMQWVIDNFGQSKRAEGGA